MKLKRYALWVLLLGIGVFLLGFMIPFVTARHLSMGIVGGADWPTYQFLLSHAFNGWPIAFILLGISVVISSGFCLLFSKTVNKHCNIKTSAISLGLSGVGAAGLVCAFWCFAIGALGGVSKHPIEFPVTMLFGVLCFLLFILLIGLYFIVRRKNWSIIGIILDVLTSIVYLPAFFMIISYVYEGFSRIFGQ